MSGTGYATTGRHRVPLDSTDGRTHRRQIATAVNAALGGHIDCTTSVTLAIGAASTSIHDARISVQTVALLAPATADAATEMGNGTIYWTTSPGLLTITHAVNAVADRTFAVVLLG